MDRIQQALKSSSLFLMVLGSINYGIITIQNFESPNLYKDIFQSNLELQQAAYIIFFASSIIYALIVISETITCSIDPEDQ